MRFALLVLVLVGSSLLSATSLPPRPWDIIRPVAHGKFVYVQLDEEARRSGTEPRPQLPWSESGLYRVGEPEHPVWAASLGVALPFRPQENLFVTDDGVTAAVLDADETPHIRFFREGKLIRSWRLPGLQQKTHRSDTNWPAVTTPFMNWEQRDNFVVVTSRSNDQYTFIIQTGELVRRRYPSQLRPTKVELAAFEAVLAGGDLAGGDDEEPGDEHAAPDQGSVPVEKAGKAFLTAPTNPQAIALPATHSGQNPEPEQPDSGLSWWMLTGVCALALGVVSLSLLVRRRL
ncbi:MAG: hypothetical protein R3E76_03605 [Planctomycetota bacterium]